jgi:hypothetical protein
VNLLALPKAPELFLRGPDYLPMRGSDNPVKIGPGETSIDLTTFTFSFDLNANGPISLSDVSMVKAQSGMELPS